MVLKIERFQPEGMNVRMSGGKPSYSHVVRVSGSGKIVYTAGQLARDIDGNCVGKGDMRAQMEQNFQNIDRSQGGRRHLGGCRQDQHLCHRLRRVPEVRRHPHALSRGGDPDQHDRRRHPSRRTRFHDRDRGGRHRQFLRSESGPTPVRRPGRPDPRIGQSNTALERHYPWLLDGMPNVNRFTRKWLASGCDRSSAATRLLVLRISARNRISSRRLAITFGGSCIGPP